MKRLLLSLMGVAVLAALTGCGGGGSSSTAAVGPVAQAAPAEAVAQAAPTGYSQSGKAGDVPVTITIEPFKPGDNSFLVSTGAPVAAVETQVVMLEMGHGGILDLTQIEDGKYQISSPVIDMDGKWMFRVKVTTASGEEKLATFYGKVQSQQ